MGRKKFDYNNKQCFYLQKIKLKKKKERKKEAVNEEVCAYKYIKIH